VYILLGCARAGGESRCWPKGGSDGVRAHGQTRDVDGGMACIVERRAAQDRQTFGEGYRPGRCAGGTRHGGGEGDGLAQGRRIRGLALHDALPIWVYILLGCARAGGESRCWPKGGSD